MKIPMTAMALNLFIVCAPISLARGWAGGGGAGGGGGGGNSGNRPICTGQEPPRQGAPFTISAAFEAKLDAYRATLAEYESTRPDESEMIEINSRLAGKACFTDFDCATGDERFVSSCLRYEWDGTNGTCLVTTAEIPQAPLPTCADVTCPDSFQCELEESTGAVGCVEQRLCRLP